MRALNRIELVSHPHVDLVCMICQNRFRAPEWIESAVAYRSKQVPVHAVQRRVVRIRLIPSGQRAVMLAEILFLHTGALDMARVMLEFRH